jgi:hypothetical protein
MPTLIAGAVVAIIVLYLLFRVRAEAAHAARGYCLHMH